MTSQRVSDFLDRVGGGSPAMRLCLLWIVATSSVAAFVPKSMIGHLLGEARFIGAIVFFLAIIGLIETVVNDLMPERFHWRAAIEIRHFALMLCSGFYLLLVFLWTQTEVSWIIVPYFAGLSFFLAWHAFQDIRKRYGPGVTE